MKDSRQAAEILADLLQLKSARACRYLAQQLAAMPGIGVDFRTTRNEQSLSETRRALTTIRRSPEDLFDRLVSNQGPRSDTAKVAEEHPAIWLVLFQYARRKFPRNYGRHLGAKGDILDVLAKDTDRIDAIRQATSATIDTLVGKISPGRGGPRRQRETSLGSATEHALEVFVTMMRIDDPETASATPADILKQHRRIARKFLRQCLDSMGFLVSIDTISRLLCDYRQQEPNSDT